jgi:hypothetical protein
VLDAVFYIIEGYEFFFYLMPKKYIICDNKYLLIASIIFSLLYLKDRAKDQELLTG